MEQETRQVTNSNIKFGNMCCICIPLPAKPPKIIGNAAMFVEFNRLSNMVNTDAIGSRI